jgi:hypothetical protein
MPVIDVESGGDWSGALSTLSRPLRLEVTQAIPHLQLQYWLALCRRFRCPQERERVAYMAHV